MEFELAVRKILSDEGGYVNNPKDPGERRIGGISKRAYPAEDIRNLTRDRAIFLYKRDYWGPSNVLPGALKYPMLDFAVNSGKSRAVKTLQDIVGEYPDGVIGPKTLGAVADWNARELAVVFTAKRLEFLTGLGNWPNASRGWTKRIAAILAHIATTRDD